MWLWLTLDLINIMLCSKIKSLSIIEINTSFVQHNFNNDSGETVTTKGRSAKLLCQLIMIRAVGLQKHGHTHEAETGLPQEKKELEKSRIFCHAAPLVKWQLVSSNDTTRACIPRSRDPSCPPRTRRHCSSDWQWTDLSPSSVYLTLYYTVQCCISSPMDLDTYLGFISC